MGRGVPMMAAALSTRIAGLQQIVVVEPADDPPSNEALGAEASAEAARSLDRRLAGMYLPFAIQLRVTPDTQRALAGSLPFIGAMRPIDGAAAAYVCRDFTCREPVTTIDALQQELGTTA